MTTTFRNVIRGVAYGDSYGDRNEFQKIDSLIKNDPKGPDLPDKLRITDDTQMSLFLADALDKAHAEDLDEADTKQAIIEAFLDYHKDPDTGSRAPGVTVMGSLGSLSRNKSGNWVDSTNKSSDGSGTVMRTSPVAFVSEDRWVGISAFAAAVTHGTANGIAAAILNVAILREELDGKVGPGDLVNRALVLATNPQDNGLLDVGTWLDDLEVNLIDGFTELARLLRIAQDALPGLMADPWARGSDPSLLIGGGGWRAHETLVIALLAVDMLVDPWEALRRSVTSDGDSDTIGAVAGALLGAAFPDLFVEKWDSLRNRFEPRYVRWIEDEADDYDFADEVVAPAPRRWYKKLFGTK